MSPTAEAALAIALDRVHWALSYPRRHREDDWDGRLRRALASLQEAWAGHGEQVESFLAPLADPTELPFTATDRLAALLRREYRDLEKESRRLCQALRRKPSVYLACFDSRQSSRARRRLATLIQRVRALLTGIGWLLAAEADWKANAPGTHGAVLGAARR
jgi:hypothetical protein